MVVQIFCMAEQTIAKGYEVCDYGREILVIYEVTFGGIR